MKQSKRRPSRGQPSREAREAAIEVAVAALSFIAAEPERLGRFLALTGIGPDSIRSAAADPAFLAGLLDYVTGDEVLLVSFAEQSEIDPEDVGRARATLAGPARGETGAA